MGRTRALSVFVAAACAAGAAAAGGPLGIDHRLNFDERGLWDRSSQRFVRFGAAALVIGAALWEGSDSRLGRTLWKSTESLVAADLASEAIKRVTRRARPIQGNNPDDWFGASSHHSFPSGEVTQITAIVTPIIAEYAHDTPAVWALAALPVYVGVARMKAQAHWQTDVLAGAALGGAIGWYEHKRDAAWVVGVLPRGVTVGLRKRF